MHARGTRVTCASCCNSDANACACGSDDRGGCASVGLLGGSEEDDEGTEAAEAGSSAGAGSKSAAERGRDYSFIRHKPVSEISQGI